MRPFVATASSPAPSTPAHVVSRPPAYSTSSA